MEIEGEGKERGVSIESKAGTKKRSHDDLSIARAYSLSWVTTFIG